VPIRGERWLVRLDFAEHVNAWGRSLTVDELIEHYRAERGPDDSTVELLVPATCVDDVRRFLTGQEREGLLRYVLEPDADHN
jgi:hypothetical protein